MAEDLRKGRELLGMTVYSVAEGKRLGEITALLVERSRHRVAAVSLSAGPLGAACVLPWEALRTVGTDIVLVDTESTLEQRLDPGAAGALDTGLSGRPVLTRSGEKLGAIMGFGVHATDGAIEVYRVKPEGGWVGRLAATFMDRGLDIPTALVEAVGPNAVIVADEAARLGATGEAGAAAQPSA